ASRRHDVAARISLATRAETASPASTTVSAHTPPLPWDDSRTSAEGTPLIRLAALISRRDSRSANGSRTTSITPPAANGQKISKTDMSELIGADTITRDSSDELKSAPAHATSATTLA